MNTKNLLLAAILLTTTLSSRNADATVVEFQTVLGNFEVNLYDNATPATVNNFLSYVNNMAYDNAVFHRLVPGFVLQGGGFTYNASFPPDPIAANAPVVNEPEFANVRGTIAMAKLGGDPNSATNQWFINLADNSANLDAQNGGFTAFGEVVGNGMDVVDAIAALSTFGFGGALTDLPLQNFDPANGVDPDVTNLIIITAVVVTDAAVDTAAALNPPTNTAPPPTTAPPPAAGGGGGGSVGLLVLLALLLLVSYRLRVLRRLYFAKAD